MDTGGRDSVEIQKIDGSVLGVNDELKKDIQDKYGRCSICPRMVRILRDGCSIAKSLTDHIKHFKRKDGLLIYNIFINGPSSRIVASNDHFKTRIIIKCSWRSYCMSSWFFTNLWIVSMLMVLAQYDEVCYEIRWLMFGISALNRLLSSLNDCFHRSQFQMLVWLYYNGFRFRITDYS